VLLAVGVSREIVLVHLIVLMLRGSWKMEPALLW